MNMLLGELQALGADWRSWAVIGLMALATAYSVIQIMKCPLLRGKVDATPEEIANARRPGDRVGLRFALVMLAGFLLALAGLMMITYGFRTTLGLIALVTGIVMIQTEPARLQIRDARRAVLSTAVDSGACEIAQGRLRQGYRSLAMINVALLVCLTGGLMAF